MKIKREYGPGQKEKIYVNLIVEWLIQNKILFEKEKAINIYSAETGKIVGTYKPDLIINGEIIIEAKSSRFTTKLDEKQLYFYLRNSEYEVGYLVNFSTPQLYIKRIIYTNDRKPFLKTPNYTNKNTDRHKA
jgi:GxxExxY protein